MQNTTIVLEVLSLTSLLLTQRKAHWIQYPLLNALGRDSCSVILFGLFEIYFWSFYLFTRLVAGWYWSSILTSQSTGQHPLVKVGLWSVFSTRFITVHYVFGSLFHLAIIDKYRFSLEAAQFSNPSLIHYMVFRNVPYLKIWLLLAWWSEVDGNSSPWDIWLWSGVYWTWIHWTLGYPSQKRVNLIGFWLMRVRTWSKNWWLQFLSFDLREGLSVLPRIPSVFSNSGNLRTLQSG